MTATAKTPTASVNGTEAAAPVPVFVAVPLSTLPKRSAPVGGRPVDMETAKALYALVSVEGQTASDGQGYAEEKLARAKANAARRLLTHALPEVTEADGSKHPAHNITSQVYKPEGSDSFYWAIWLTAYKARKPKAAKAAATS